MRCMRFPWLPNGWWMDPNYAYQLSVPSPQEEMAALEECKNSLGKEKNSIEQEINDIEKHIKELKSKLDSEKNQQPTSQ
jgi:predicted  nucleic acid-binding Zn-ribbon protein